MNSKLDKLVEKMKKAGLNDTVIKSFEYYYNLVLKGETGKIPESEIKPPSEKNIIDYTQLSPNEIKPNDLVIIKLNGGLGTSMGLNKAKSLLPVKKGYTFLDIIANQILVIRKNTRTNLPILFMNSFNTQKDTLDFLKKYPDLSVEDLGLDFVQNKYPKIKREDLSPLENEEDKKNWNPPGHGEIYSVMATSGLLDKLLAKGYEYAFISNSDNLGAIYDDKIYYHIKKQNIPFLMEVAIRTELDKKGGHLAETKDGQLLLRETAQCPKEDIKEFQNVNKYRFFNTNSLWVNLKVLKRKLEENHNFLPLPLILNGKEVDGTKVYQLESAMGAAIQLFEGSKAMVVPRSRFLPVKKTNDLLLLESDIFDLTKDFHLIKTTKKPLPLIQLDEKYYKSIDDFKMRFVDVPSLKECDYLKITGDIVFEGNVKISGKMLMKAECKTIIKVT